MPTFDSTTGVKILSEAIEILNSIDINPWIQDGTLLGAVREGDIIDWDFDMDLGVYSHEWSQEAEILLIKNNYILKNSYNTLEDRLHLKWSKDGIQFDIFLYYEYDENYVYHGVTQEHALSEGKKYIFLYKNNFTFTKIDLLGYSLTAPFPPEDFLIQKYGENWKTPIQEWNAFTSPRNSKVII